MFYNISGFDNIHYFHEPVVPQWCLISYFICLVTLNFGNVRNIYKLCISKRDGTQSLLLQLAFVDLFTIVLAILELITLNYNHPFKWQLPLIFCPIYKGFEVLINTLTVYLIACVTFHVGSIKKTTLKDYLRTQDNDSNQCLVVRRETTNAEPLNYGTASALLPSLCVWFVAASLSVPNFTLANTVPIQNNATICTIIVDEKRARPMHYLKIVFEFLVPFSLLLLAVLQLVARKQIIVRNVTKIWNVRLVLVLGGIYTLVSLQRGVLQVLQVLYWNFDTGKYMDGNNGDLNFLEYLTPPLYSYWYLGESVLVYLAMFHYLGGALRGVFYTVIFDRFEVKVSDTNLD